MEIVNLISRRILIGSLQLEAEVVSVLHEAYFLTLLPAYSLSESEAALRVSEDLLKLGCKEFCCVGPYADKLHDEIDAIVEDRDTLEVITTSFVDEADACDYFVFGADAGEAPVLLGLISGHPALERKLRELALEDRGQV